MYRTILCLLFWKHPFHVFDCDYRENRPLVSGIDQDISRLRYDTIYIWSRPPFSNTKIRQMIFQNRTYLSIKYIDKFCMTQNMPTQKSATAKLAKKKFVIDRRRRDNVTTNMTNRFPKGWVTKILCLLD